MSIQVAIAQINCTVGDFAGNHAKIIEAALTASQAGADIVLTPELSLCGYPPEDLLLRPGFFKKVDDALAALQSALAIFPDLYVILGHPIMRNGERFNAASVLFNGEILGTYCKHALPNHMVFDEIRYFNSADTPFIFTVKGTRFGINICEDVWSTHAPSRAKEAGAEVLLILNGSPYHMEKQHVRYDIMRQNVIPQGLSIVYANLIGGQDELLFDGNSFAMNQEGEICAQLPHCKEAIEFVTFDGATPRKKSPQQMPSLEAMVYQALVLGVRDYIGKNGFPSVLIGLSGGVDSALTLAIAVDALGAENVRAVMMPSPYTAQISLDDAKDMAERVNVRYDSLPIQACFSAFNSTLSNEFSGLAEDTTEENIQARIRGTLLMALSNKHGSIVLTTGNKSEMAVGYCTLYGDMAGGFAVVKDIAKTFLYRLCDYRNTLSDIIPSRILTRAPSAELKPDQTDQDSLPPYEVLDPIMQMYMEENKSAEDIIAAGFDEADVARITRLIRINEYKRRQSPIGIRVTERAFGRDWRYPITSKFDA